MGQEKSLDRNQSVLIFTPHADVFSFVSCFSVFLMVCTAALPVLLQGLPASEGQVLLQQQREKRFKGLEDITHCGT